MYVTAVNEGSVLYPAAADPARGKVLVSKYGPVTVSSSPFVLYCNVM